MGTGHDTSTATVLFTDVVGSTEGRGRLGEERADELRRRHDRIVIGALESHHGRVVKGLGDGVMAVFTSASDALAAAVGAQVGIDRHNRYAPSDEKMAIRVGVAVGDVSTEGGDCFGTPVIEAARLCAAAPSGAIWASDVVRVLAGTRGGHEFVPVGPIVLKNLHPVNVVEVTWRPEAPDLALPPALQHACAGGATPSLVGRVAERVVLERALKSAGSAAPTMVLVSGEAGIGKTRLVAEIAREAHHQGAAVLYGRCEEEGAVPYQPFAEALANLAGTYPPADFADAAGALGGELTRLLPGLGVRIPALPAALPAEPETERYRLFEAVGDLLSGLSARFPTTVVILDDLQWASTPTLCLLRHLLGRGDGTRLALIGTYRDTDLSRTSPLTAALADLRRDRRVERLSLAGLGPDDMEAFVAEVAGHDLDDDSRALAAALHAETEGNPFFAGEVLRHLTQTGAVAFHDGRWRMQRTVGEIGLPEGIREVIGQRLSRLPQAAESILATAAVVGREFELDVVAAAAGVSAEAVLDAVEAAERTRLVVAVPGRPGHFAFTHALVRSTLNEELPTSRRLRLHRAVGLALEARSDATQRVAELAHHFGEAAALGEAERAVRYARAAGETARAGLAFEEAAAHFEAALAACEIAPVLPDRDRCDLMIAAGEARRFTQDPAARRWLFEAGALARSMGDIHRLAAAAFALQPGIYTAIGSLDLEVVAFIKQALELLGDADPPLRARLLAALALELSWSSPPEPRTTLAAEAVAEARRLLSGRALARVLLACHRATHGPDNLESRLNMADEARSLAEAAGDPELEGWSYVWLAGSHVEAGDVRSARQLRMQAEAAATEARQPTVQCFAMLVDGVQRVLDDDVIGHEAWVSRLRRLVREHPGIVGGVLPWVEVSQRAALALHRAGVVSMETEIDSAAIAQPSLHWWSSLRALVAAEAGRLDEARTRSATLWARIDELPRDITWLHSMTALAMAVCVADDKAGAHVLFDALSPFSGRLSWSGFGSLGPIDLTLGLLAVTLDRPSVADTAFAAAVELCDREHLRSWGARSRAEWAAALAARDKRDTARPLAVAAMATAEELHLTNLVSRMATRSSKPGGG